MVGIDDRPRASCSDAIAAAVLNLLDHDPPAPLDLARYAEAGRQAAACRGRDAPACQPVSYYLPGLGGLGRDHVLARNVLARRAGITSYQCCLPVADSMTHCPLKPVISRSRRTPGAGLRSTGLGPAGGQG